MISSDIRIGQELQFSRTDGSIVPVTALGEPFFGPFGWTVRCLVTDGAWSGQHLDIQTVHLTVS